MKTGPRPTPLIDRFFANIGERSESNCWEWQGHTNEAGYGLMSIAAGNRKYKQLRAHRFSFEIHWGPIEPGNVVCHACDNPKCVNPHHLFEGTQKDNVQDAKIKGRLAHKFKELRTHCKNGHEFTIENTKFVNGGKHCRTCAKQASRRHYYKHQEHHVQRTREYRASISLRSK